MDALEGELKGRRGVTGRRERKKHRKQRGDPGKGGCRKWKQIYNSLSGKSVILCFNNIALGEQGWGQKPFWTQFVPAETGWA